MIDLWLQDIESLEAVTQDEHTKRICLRMATSQTGCVRDTPLMNCGRSSISLTCYLKARSLRLSRSLPVPPRRSLPRGLPSRQALRRRASLLPRAPRLRRAPFLRRRAPRRRAEFPPRQAPFRPFLSFQPQRGLLPSRSASFPLPPRPTATPRHHRHSLGHRLARSSRRRHPDCRCHRLHHLRFRLHTTR